MPTKLVPLGIIFSFPCWSTSLESQSSGHGWEDVRQKLQAWNIFPCIHLSSRPGGAEVFIEFILILETLSCFLSVFCQFPLMSIFVFPLLNQQLQTCHL